MAFTARLRPDETFCSALCQHPTCWDSQRRIVRGVPHVVSQNLDSSDSEDEELPSQAVVNLLEAYGPDPTDRYPSRHGGRALHNRSKSVSAMERAKRRESLPKSRAPNATPVTPMQSTNTLSAGSGTAARKSLGKVEVQEVFDVADLNSHWHETFLSKKCLVWVPNPKHKPKQPDPKEEVSAKQLAEGPPCPLNVRDLTEDMVPREVEWQREKSMLHRCKADRRSPLSFYTMSPISSHKLSQQGYHGLHELLDLPRDVLAQLVSHISESEMLDRERFADALLRTLPKLQRENTTVSLAYGNVLQQHQLPLNDKRNLAGLEPIPVRQVFLMDEPIMEQMSTTNLASTYRSYLSQPTPTPREGLVPPINVKSPLPDIPRGRVDYSVGDIDSGRGAPAGGGKTKAASISLGLPSIPSGVRHTKTFDYRKQDPVDFTLGPVPSPPPPLPTEKQSDSPASTERSSILVTMPTVPKDDVTNPNETLPLDSEVASKDKQAPKSPTLQSQMDSTTVGIFSSSPSQSVPSPSKREPQRRPVPQVVNVKLPQEQPPSRAGTQESIPIPRPPPTTPNPALISQPTYTPDMAGILGPIQEADHTTVEDNKPDARVDGQLVRSRGGRSVHFGPDVPANYEQPPSTPNESEPGVSVADSPTPAMDASMMMHYSERSENEYEGLMVIGKGAQRQDAQPQVPMEIPEFPPTKVPTGTPSESPEPWPQVDEDAYRMMSPQLAPKSVGTAPSRNDSEPVCLPTSAGALSSASIQSDKIKKMLQDEETESPGPPPPSPEAREENPAPPLLPGLVTSQAHSSNGSGLAILKEETSESEAMTISAKPPSNLDDISRINTPNSYASRGFYSQEPTMDNLGPLAEASSQAELPASTGQSEEQLLTSGSQPNVPAAEASPNPASLPAEQMLDMFQATQEQFDDELKAEYEKLSDSQQADDQS